MKLSYINLPILFPRWGRLGGGGARGAGWRRSRTSLDLALDLRAQHERLHHLRTDIANLSALKKRYSYHSIVLYYQFKMNLPNKSFRLSNQFKFPFILAIIDDTKDTKKSLISGFNFVPTTDDWK